MVTTILTEGFEHGPDGDQVTDANTVLLTPFGSFSSTQVHSGALALGVRDPGTGPGTENAIFQAAVPGDVGVAVTTWVYADGVVPTTVNGGPWSLVIIGPNPDDPGGILGLVVGQYLNEALGAGVDDPPIPDFADALVFVLSYAVNSDGSTATTQLQDSSQTDGRWTFSAWQQFTLTWLGDDSWTVRMGDDSSGHDIPITTDRPFIPGLLTAQMVQRDLGGGTYASNWMDDVLITVPDGATPVTRLYPRDDGLGTSSAPRNYPSHKGARVVGGYT